jgi:hypothetical protein
MAAFNLAARHALRASGIAIARPREFMEAPATIGSERSRLAAATLPLACSVLLVALMSAALPGSGDTVRRFTYPLFVGATLPAACLAYRLTGALLGSKAAYLAIFASWGQSYWATALFLATLAITHIGASAMGLEPSELPEWASFALLSTILGAAIWKFLMALALLRFAMGLRGLRLATSVAVMLVWCAAFAVLSAIAFGTKVPVL